MYYTLEQLLPILKKVTIFAGLGEENISRIAEKCEIVKFPAGDVIIREGEQGKDILIIISGTAKVILDIDREALEIIQLGAGKCLGEVSVIGILNHSASVVAIEDIEVLVLSRKIMMEIFDRDKNLFSILILNIARELARRLHHTDEILLHYGKRAAGIH
ncbi:MAG: cyclic nucleotide-binding domain-containing protein [Chitinivibrionales bacterium]|nr:cyclic nucleotide-binding domain-containing protein [Chitinivibrionales bacterium]